MPTYIMLVKWTQAGIERVKDAPQRIERARNAVKSVGGEMRELYYTFGKYDTVSIIEAPSDEAMMKALLIIGSTGAAKTETLTAIPEAKGVEIIKELP
jgi:uncharacterized protein with GYD domain